MKGTKRRLSLLAVLSMVFVMAFSTVAVNADTNADGLFSKNTTVRYAGQSRYETSLKTADALKVSLGVEEFDSVVLAYGGDFPDALGGGYLAQVKKAPVITVDKTAVSEKNVADYLKDNLKDGGDVYILGGTGVVTPRFEKALRSDGYKVNRLAANNRYGTNIAVLKEAGKSDKGLLVCNGLNYADALSASAVDMPILIVDKALSQEQKAFIKEYAPSKVYLIGGTGAVNSSIEKAIRADYEVERVSGATRHDTSVEVAKKFFDADKVDTITLAYAMNFPDGLSGGPLSASLNAPMLLVNSTNGKKSIKAYDAAKAYRKTTNAYKCATFGGTALIADEDVYDIMYNYITTKDYYQNQKDYKLLDTRAKSAFETSHIPASYAADMTSATKAKDYSDATAVANIEAVMAENGTKYVINCNTGNSLARAAAGILATKGVDPDDILILKGGMAQWNKDYPKYVVKTFESSGGFNFMNGITKENFKADLDGDKTFVGVDVRKSSLYAEGHIAGSVSADVTTNDAKANIGNVVNHYPGERYVIICNSGNSLVDKARSILMNDYGVDEEMIICLEGGDKDWVAAKYPKVPGFNVATESDVKAALEDSKAVVLDARTQDAYSGWSTDANRLGGHIDGAKGFSALWLTCAYNDESNNDGRTRAERLNIAMEEKGISTDTPVIVYDETGIEAEAVANFLKSKGVTNVKTFDLNKWTGELQKYDNYQQVLPPSVVKKLIDGETVAEVGKVNDLKILEFSYGTEDKSYVKGHVPTAVHINSDDIDDANHLYILQSDENLYRTVTNAGVTKDSTVVVTGDGLFAAHLATVIKYLGCDNVYIMSGGKNGWTDAGYKAETGSNKATPAADFGTDKPTNPDYIDTAEEAQALLKSSDAQLVDTRTMREYTGKWSGYDYVNSAGRLDGAVFGQGDGSKQGEKANGSSMMYYENIDGTMKDADEIQAMWKASGVDTNKHLSFYCGGGYRAAAVMWYADTMGMKNVSLYNDGWDGCIMYRMPGAVKGIGENTVAVDYETEYCAPVTPAVTVDEKAKTVSFYATANGDYLAGDQAPIYHFVTSSGSKEGNGGKAAFDSKAAKPADLYAGLEKIGGVAWTSKSTTQLKKGQTLKDVKSDATNYSKLNLEIYEGDKKVGDVKDVVKYVKNGKAQDTPDISMAFSGNLINNTNWNPGCMACLVSCYAGITSNENVAFGTDSKTHNYFYLDSDKIKAGHVYKFVYSIAGEAEPEEPTTNYASVDETFKAITDESAVILDARQVKDYESAHIPGAISATVYNADTKGPDATAASSKKNIKDAVAKYGVDKKYYVACYRGVKYAAAATELLRAEGVSNDNIFTIEGGMAAWTEHKANYVVKTYDPASAKTTFQNGITVANLKADLDGSKKFTVVDVRTAENFGKGHIKGAIAADVTTEAAEANLEKVVKNHKGEKYVIVCNTGNGLAKKARDIMRDNLGIDEKDIIILEGGDADWVAAGYEKVQDPNYITAENLVKNVINADKTDYKIIDVRQIVDESGKDMGSFEAAHILTAVSAPLMTNDYKKYSDEEAIANLKAAGVNAEGTDKYVLVCYYGGEVAERARELALKMGVNNDRLFILEGGQWSMDPEWSFMADHPYDSPNYFVNVGSSKSGMKYFGVTPAQVAGEMDKTPNPYAVLLDTREVADYQAGHIKGAISTAIPGGKATSEEGVANVKNAIKTDAPNAIYVIICYSGNSYADACQKILEDNGVPSQNIVRIVGGHNAFAKDFADKIVK